jgi:hypothetical protein
MTVGDRRTTRRGAFLALVLLVPFAAAVLSAPPPASPPQDDVRTCLVCHDDAELESSAGTSVYVKAEDFAASTHGRAGIGCLGCHADLKGVEDFPHAAPLRGVTCSACHGDHARTSPGGVHGTSSPRLAAKPVLCKDCHGYHDVLPSTDAGSSVHPSRRPETCGRCHAGAGANFARGRVHEYPAGDGPTPAGVVRVLYKALIGVMTGFFLVYIAVDLRRWRRER